MAGSRISRMELGNQLEGLLAGGLASVTGQVAVSVYRGEVPVEMPVLTVDGVPDESGRIAPYVVLFDGVGTPGIEPDLADENDDLVWSPQMILGAGFERDCANLVDRVHSLAYRWSPVLSPVFEGLSFGRLRPPPGYDPGPLRRDGAVPPYRWWTPLQWRLEVTAS